MANTHLIISTSNELLRIAAHHIICIKAEGNYSHICQPRNVVKKVTFQLCQMETMINEQLPDIAYMFVRVGKGLIININYIYHIDLVTKKIILMDDDYYQYDDNVSRDALKSLKDQIDNREELKKCL